MALAEKSIGNPGKEDEARLVGALLYNARTRDLMKAQRIHSAVHHGGLTVAFLPNKDFSKSQLFSGLDNFLGNAHCAGIRIIPEKDLYHDDKLTKAYGEARHSLLGIVRQDRLSLGEDTRVALVTAGDIRHWIAFEKEVASGKLEKSVGAKVWSYSGLRRLDPDRYQGQMEAWKNLLNRKGAYLQSKGVSYKEEKGSEGIGVFVDRSGKYKPVPLCHVKERTSKRSSEIVTEVIHDEPVLCPAVIIRALGESKNEAYNRSQQLAAHFKKTYGWTNIHVPIISAGQLSAWEKLGFDKPSDTYVSSVPISWMDLVRYTHLQKDNLHPGPLAKLGISLPSVRKAHQHGVDIIFEKRVGLGFKGVTLDGVLGVVKDADGKDVVKSLNRVGAIIVGPANISADEMKNKYIYPAQQLLKRDIFSGESQAVNIAYVTPALFKQWKTQGMFAPEDKAKKPLLNILPKPMGERTRWGKRTSAEKPKPQYEMSQYWQIRQVGFQRTVFRVKDAFYFNDFGASHSESPIAFRSLLGQDKTSDGLARKLDHGVLPLPLIPTFSRPLMILTAKNRIGLFDQKMQDPISRAIRGFLIHNFQPEYLAQEFGSENARKLNNFKSDEQSLYDQNYYLAALFISHIHVDHIGEIYALNLADSKHAVPIGISPASFALLSAMDHRARNWKGKHLFNVDPTQKVGNGYVKFQRDFHLMHTGDVMRFADGFWAQAAEGNHSTEGPLSFLYGFPNGVKVFCSNDLRSGPKTDKMLNLFAGRPDVIKMEATNLPTGEKTSAVVTEEDVAKSLIHHFKEANRAGIIVEISPNNIERLEEIVAAAHAVGRKVAVDYDIAEYLRGLSDLEAVSRSLPLVGPQLALWKRVATRPLPFQKALIAHAEKYGALVDSERFQKESSDYVVVTTPYRLHESDMKIVHFPQSVVLIHSAPYLYTQEAKDLVGANYQYIRRLGGKYISDFTISYSLNQTRVTPVHNPKWPVHASGHAQLVDNRDPDKRQKDIVDYLMTLLGENRKGKIVMFDHTESGKKAVDAVKQKMGKSAEGVIFIGSIPKYNVNDPDSGFKLDLDNLPRNGRVF